MLVPRALFRQAAFSVVQRRVIPARGVKCMIVRENIKSHVARDIDYKYTLRVCIDTFVMQL